MSNQITADEAATRECAMCGGEVVMYADGELACERCGKGRWHK